MPILPDAKLYIDGELRDAVGGKSFDIVSPWTASVVGKAADAGSEDVEAAIAAARRAFDDTDWADNRDRRYGLVKKLRLLFEKNRNLLSDLARHEAGAALGAVELAHVGMALNCWDDLIDCFPKVTWEKDYGDRECSYGFSSSRLALYEPVGVVGAITPWNVPLYVNIGKVVSALLAGCTVILKPAPNTPGMGAIFGELAKEAGFPPGVLNVITGEDPAMAGEILVTDPRVDLISFTGSTAVGKHIMATAGSTLKRIFLELGGKSAKIVLDDSPNFAMEIMTSALIFHAGQGCAVQSRLLVPESRLGEVKELLKQAYAGASLRWGEFDNPEHIMGPVVSKKQFDRVMDYIRIGQEEGASILVGGKARPDMGDGFFIEPTCFVDVKNDMRIAQEEIFGPVLAVISYTDDQNAIEIANDSQYGLSGGVAGGDKKRVMNIVRRVRAGSISVNGGMCIDGDLPFGGYKASGIGREWGVEGIEEFLETKIVATRIS